MENQRTAFKQLVKRKKHIGIFSMLIGVLGLIIMCHTAGSTKPSQNGSLVYHYCKTLNEESTTKNTDRFGSSFCRDLIPARALIEVYTGQFKMEAPTGTVLLICLEMFIGLFAFLYGYENYSIGSNKETIVAHFGMNQRDSFLFNWISELRMRKIYTSEAEFDSWMGEFRERYTERDMEIMKLNFTI